MTDVVTQEAAAAGRSSRSRDRASPRGRHEASRRPSSRRRSDRRRRDAVQQALSTDAFRVYTHDDVIGVELGGALKNVMAVATGIAEGLGLGFNSRAALITRGLAEMTRLGVALGARVRRRSRGSPAWAISC